MLEITISSKVILKLLSNLKTDKAAGLDDIKPLVLKELRNEITPLVKANFEKALASGQLPKDCTQAKGDPSLYKGC